MGNAVQTRSVTVLQFRGVTTGIGAPVYQQYEPEDEGRDHTVTLDPQVWRDMGMPSEISVAIYPGDVLNDESHPAYEVFQ